MSPEVLSALILFVLVSALTPGPNNLMLLASGVNFGFRRTVPHMIGTIVGFMALLFALGFGIGTLVERFPAIYIVLKVIGGSYLLYLAWKIAGSRAIHEAETGRGPLSFGQATLFQLINPKSWVVGLAAIAAFTDPDAYLLTAGAVIGAFFCASTPAIVLWTGFGSALKDWLAHPVRLKWFNIAMSLALVASLWPMLR
ncbi:LysE family translocator [Afifella pfennigii]|uniref:LysE family translocator n=1 Tax=Afifella pfennigii TaxID=209897 RepID=UPI00047AD2FE|nr:LysE family translocator [Afifella pfennigii]